MKLRRWLLPIINMLICYTVSLIFVWFLMIDFPIIPVLSALITAILAILCQASYIIPLTYYSVKFLPNCKYTFLLIIYQASLFAVPIAISSTIDGDGLGFAVAFLAFTATFILCIVGWLIGKAIQKTEPKNAPYTAQFENVTMDDPIE